MMRKLSLVLALALVFLGISVPISVSAQEDRREQARVLFQRGVARFEAEDFVSALSSFQEAYGLAPHPTVRVNMANCYDRMGRPLEALHHFEQFLAETSGQGMTMQRREVQRAEARLLRQIASLRFNVHPDGALITIDSGETRRAPVTEAVRLVPGVHHFEIALRGYRTEHRELTVEAGATPVLSVTLQRGQDRPAVASGLSNPSRENTSESQSQRADDAAADDGEPQEASEPSETAIADAGDDDAQDMADAGEGFELRLTMPVIVSGGVALALAGAAIGTGVAALGANDTFEQAVLESNNASLTATDRFNARLNGEDAAANASALAIATDVLIVGASVAAAATVFFLLFSDESEDVLANDSEVVVVPVASHEMGGVMMIGAF